MGPAAGPDATRASFKSTMVPQSIMMLSTLACLLSAITVHQQQLTLTSPELA